MEFYPLVIAEHTPIPLVDPHACPAASPGGEISHAPAMSLLLRREGPECWVLGPPGGSVFLRVHVPPLHSTHGEVAGLTNKLITAISSHTSGRPGNGPRKELRPPQISLSP